MNDTNASTTENANSGNSFHSANDGAQRRARSLSPMTMIGNGTPPIRLDGIYKHM